MYREAATHLVRAAARNDVGRRSGQIAYRAAARAAAAWLARIPDVDGVYLTGSSTRPARVDPGYSDIDLVLVTDLPTLEREMRFRRTLRRHLGALHRVVPAFHQADYVDRTELGVLRRWPNAWAMGLDERWECLGGVDRRDPSPPSLPRRQRRLERLRRALRRWLKASVVLLSPDRGASLRTARRLLADVSAAWLDGDRLAPWSELAEAAGHRPAASTGVAALLGMALDVLERFAREVAPEEGGSWQTRGALAPLPDLESIERACRRGGLELLVASRDPHSTERFAIAMARRDDGPADALARASRGLEALRRTEGAGLGTPIVLTPTLFAAAWLLDVPPFAAASLALAGRTAPPPPPADDLAHLLPVLLVERVHRARGRMFRLRSSRRAARSTWRDIESIAVGLEAVNRGEPMTFVPNAPDPPDERAMVASIRALSTRLRASLRP